MSKLYVFLTHNISHTGGVQPYVAGKAKYLANAGWTIKILHASFLGTKSIYKDLLQFTDGAFPELCYPPYCYSRAYITSALERMEKYLGDSNAYEQIIFESHFDCAALWGELLAHQIKAKHITVAMAETFRGRNEHYIDNLDFYDFKFQRGEVGCSYFALEKLFAGYRTVTQKDATPFRIDEDPIADVENDRVKAIEKYDYNICHIGRIIKEYVPSAMNGVRRFADAHPDKRIQLIFVGSIDGRREEIAQIFSGATNVRLLELGDLVPIPRMLFEKVDVVVACSGSARHSAVENVPVVAVAINGQSNGLLGYETKESLYPAEKQWPVEEVLERALIGHRWQSMPFDFPKLGVAKCCEQNSEFIRNSSQTKEYYSEDKLLKRPAHVGIDRLFKCWLFVRFPKLARKLIDIKVKYLKA